VLAWLVVPKTRASFGGLSRSFISGPFSFSTATYMGGLGERNGLIHALLVKHRHSTNYEPARSLGANA